MPENLSAKHESRAEITLSKKSGINYKKLLSPQSGKARGRSSTAITETSAGLKITIKADDLAALHASINSIMREIRVLDSIGGLKLKDRSSGKQGR